MSEIVGEMSPICLIHKHKYNNNKEVHVRSSVCSTDVEKCIRLQSVSHVLLTLAPSRSPQVFMRRDMDGSVLRNAHNSPYV